MPKSRRAKPRAAPTGRHLGGAPTTGASSSTTRSASASVPNDGGSIVINIEPGVLPLVAILAVVGVLAVLWFRGLIQLPATPDVDAGASLWLIFITGLTAGGLSCLAVQGGLLATTIAQREQRLIEAHVEDQARLTEHAAPILLFLAAKLTAYTALGALLGLVGSFIALTPTMRGLLQVGIGVFMLGVALQMLDVHPIFRYFALQPPRWAQRLIRKHSKRDDVATPLFLGALTVLIPCGVTQAMMLVAMASGSAARGALIMFAFVLGSSPVFFILGLLATRLSAAMHGAFLKLAAVTVALLAVLSIIGGYRLLPLSSSAAAAGPPAADVVAQVATINVLAHGYDPPVIQVKAGRPSKINLVTNSLYGCTRSFVIPSLNVERILPATGTETLDIPASQPGQIAYTCGMGMYSGVIEVVQ